MSTQEVPIVSFLKELMRHRKRLPSQLAADLGISHATVSRWLSATDLPSTAMKRHTLFHEAFHILAHHSGTPVFRKRGVEGGYFNEGLADYFAICILMPRQWVEEKWAEVKDVNRMAKNFKVPRIAMWLRLRQLGLV